MLRRAVSSVASLARAAPGVQIPRTPFALCSRFLGTTPTGPAPISVAKPPGHGKASRTQGVAYLRHLEATTGPLYALVEVKGRPYHITRGDLLTVPRLHVPLGSTMALDKVREIGGAQVTVRGNPFVDAKVAKISAVVVEHWLSAKRQTVKTKRRKGYKRTIGHRQHLTSLRITDLSIEASK